MRSLAPTARRLLPLVLLGLLGLLAQRGCRQPRRLRYFVPAGFEGWAHVVYTNGATGGRVHRPGPHRETYVLPANGQLVVRDPLPEAGPVQTEYYAYTPGGRVWALGPARGPHIHGTGGMGTLAVEPTAYGYLTFYVTRRALSWEQAQAYAFPPDTLLHQDNMTPDSAHPFAPPHFLGPRGAR